MKFRIQILPAFIISMLVALTCFSQQTQSQFGQNRVQYHKFTWSFYTSDNFVTYFYLGGQEIGKYVIQYAEKHLPEIEEKLEYRLGKPINFLVYTDITDLNQSNIGISLDIQNNGGVTKIIDNKVFLYFNGDHNDLERQVREGIVKILLDNMMFGSSLQEILQNAVLLNLPKWFIDGLIAYVGQGWNPELDDKLRDGMLLGKFEKFNKLQGEDASFAGHALWYYVAEKYGASAVPNLLYLTRINRSIESGFLFVLGNTVNRTMRDWQEYYLTKYSMEAQNKMPVDSLEIIPKRTRKNRDYYQAKMSKDGEAIAYASNQTGRVKVFVKNLETGKTRRLIRAGLKTVTLSVDNGYPLIAWSPKSDQLAVIYEKRDKVKLLLYDKEKRKKQKKTRQ